MTTSIALSVFPS